MIVDDLFFTLGSANFVDISWKKDHTELNIAVWDERVARSLRWQLFEEHLGEKVDNISAGSRLFLGYYCIDYRLLSWSANKSL